ncbi:MAG: asparagine synthase (glutamine-hydrolyzing) [Patescibacteria group bacterium]
MCGIAGYVGNGSREALRRMGEAIARRGPDDHGTHEAPGVGFAFRRLSIIDVEGGHQPISNEDASVWVMLNGEIYGFASLRDELIRSGHRFRTRTDTEVVVHAYEEWGDACFGRLEGMFALAIWDAHAQRLVLARDRLGKKPLHWTTRNGTIWFASELKALLAAGIVDRDIDPVSLGLYFRTDAVPTPRTIFRGVSKMEPATAMAWRNGEVERTWSFWRCPLDVMTDPSPKDVVAGLGACVDGAVRERLVSDVPLGLFLSGGLDSAVVAESASRQSSTPLKAFTVGFDEASHDETPIARMVAKALGLDHHVETLTAGDALLMLDEAIRVLDEPLADPSILPQLLLSRFTRRHVTVALSGDGGDELLLGYQHIPAHVWTRRLVRLPLSIRSVAASLLASVPAGGGYFSAGFKAQRLARGIAIDDPWTRDTAWRGAFTADGLTSILAPDVASAAFVGTAETTLALRADEAVSDPSDEQDDFWKRWTWAYLRTFLMDDVMVKVDRATMWYALEARAPLLDRSVVEYLLKLPSSFKLGRWSGKRLFKELLAGRVPDAVLRRPKHGFGVPVADWLRGPLADRLAELTSPTFLTEQGLFDTDAVGRLVAEHSAKRVDRRKELWAVLMFQLWYRRWMMRDTSERL